MADSPEPQQPEAYLRLLATHDRSLSTYVHSLVLNGADAEDILQECKVVLWKKFDQSRERHKFFGLGPQDRPSPDPELSQNDQTPPSEPIGRIVYRIRGGGDVVST